MSASVSDFRVSSSDRLSSGEITENDGFSVVAAISVTSRFSTAGSSTSCWALEKRCTSSTNSTVPVPRASSRWASASAARTSLTPAVTADSSTNRRCPDAETTAAMVVLPTPGGPQRKTDIAVRPSASRRSGEPGPSRWSWPTISSTVRGRIRTASGVSAWPALLSEPAGRRRGCTAHRVAEQVRIHLADATPPRGRPASATARRRRRPDPCVRVFSCLSSIYR